MKYILFPGRHHIVTRFQVQHLQRLVAANPGAVVVWAVTSANHSGTQRNPIAGERRLGMIEAVAAHAQLASLVFLIPNRQPKVDFAHYVIQQIRTQTDGAVAMTPANTIVACSTRTVIVDYEALGFTIDPVELGAGTGGTSDPLRPWQVLDLALVHGFEAENVTKLVHPAALDYYDRYGLAEHIRRVHNDPLIDTDDGDITLTRDYETYRAAFESNAWRKVNEFAEFVRPGRIVDVGCATGQTIKLLSERPELFESDFYGVEVARPLYEICQQRATNGEFGDANVFFHHRNIMQTELFEPSSIDTVITMALTHEIESYMGRQALDDFCARVFTMLRPGGVWINYDVVGPAGGDTLVLARFNTADGADHGELPELNSRARFLRFARDFRHDEGDTMSFRVVTRDGQELFELRRADLYDFLAKKDYVTSWFSEMHERFCFFSPTQWREQLARHGLVCVTGTRGIRNPWLIENRFAPAASAFNEAPDGTLEPDEWSYTNVLLVAEKPIG